MSQQDEVRDTINALFEVGGIKYEYTGPITENTAQITVDMYMSIRECTTALNWVPRPTGGRATIARVARNLGTSFIRELKKRNISFLCARTRMYQYRVILETN